MMTHSKMTHAMMTHAFTSHPHILKTEENIFKAFQGESRTKTVFEDFAEKAEKEGFLQAARLFRAAAVAEGIHARSLLSSLHEMSRETNELWMAGGYSPETIMGSTEDNLKQAIVECLELSKMYPQMVRDTEKDGSSWNLAKECFTYDKAVDEIHASLFMNILQNLDKRDGADYYVCEACGNTIEGKPVSSCKVCGSSERAFMVVQ
jgi:rubrerythrin